MELPSSSSGLKSLRVHAFSALPTLVMAVPTVEESMSRCVTRADSSSADKLPMPSPVSRLVLGLYSTCMESMVGLTGAEALPPQSGGGAGGASELLLDEPVSCCRERRRRASARARRVAVAVQEASVVRLEMTLAAEREVAPTGTTPATTVVAVASSAGRRTTVEFAVVLLEPSVVFIPVAFSP